ncbi:MAG: response regulator [Selenomonadaceae bacterium]|nr:response regulator [Selenomonadaceae bacterium]
MRTELLFISQGVSFMGNSIQKNLESAGYDVTRVDPEIKEIAAKKDEIPIFVFYLGKFVEDNPEVLVYLKDVCLEEEKFLILLGNLDELSFVENTLPPTAISAKFERPIDLKKLTAEVQRLVHTVDEREMKKSILLVDDDPTFLKMMKSWLDYEYRVTIVTSGMQALMYLAENKPDLILLDYEMPVTSGPQVLEMIRSETKIDNVPVIFLTGKGDKQSVMNVLSLKPDGYLLKSLNREQILESVYEFFEKKRASDLLKMARTRL